MKKVEDIYCVYCGTKNKISNKKCFKCSKKIDPKEDSFKNYMIDKFKSDADSSIYDLIKSFLLHHIYGILLTVTVVFTFTSIIINQSNIDIVSTNKYLSGNGNINDRSNNTNNEEEFYDYEGLDTIDQELFERLTGRAMDYVFSFYVVYSGNGASLDYDLINSFYYGTPSRRDLYNYMVKKFEKDPYDYINSYCQDDGCSSGVLRVDGEDYIIFVQDDGDKYHYELTLKEIDGEFYIIKDVKVSGKID